MYTKEDKYIMTDWDKIPAELLKKLIKEHAFSINLLANDTFGYACADSETVDDTDIWKLLEVYEKWGACGVDAFMAHLRGEEVLSQLQFPDYKAAKEYLKDFIPFEKQR